MKMKSFRVQIETDYLSTSALFMHGSFSDLGQYLAKHGNPDIGDLQDADGGSVGDIIWVSDAVKSTSLDFIPVLAHECVHFADQVVASAPANVDVDRASIVSHLVSEVLSELGW